MQRPETSTPAASEATRILELLTVPEAIPSATIMDLEGNSDRCLMERFREGDRDAFTELYRTHYPAIFRFAFYMTGDRVKAGEVTQDVFVWLIHHPAEFDPERGGLPAFLGGVARKLLLRRERNERRWLPLPRFETRDSADAAVDLAHAIDTAALRKAIALLPGRYREAVVLCDLESRSYEEAAALLGCAIGTIRSRLHRARQLLVRKLQPRKETRESNL
jgi:RNA polymerase sigma-70 factor (ECF subfamily)